MTEIEAIELIEKDLKLHSKNLSGKYKNGLRMAIKALEEIQQYRAIGTVEDFKALKEKNEPKELAEHNFQDEVHYYMCPSCRSIVSCNQNYCDECGQALEN